MCAQIMGSFSSLFRTLLWSYHNILYSCGSQDHWPSWFNWYLLIACFNWYLLIARLLVSLFVMSLWHIILQQSLCLNIVCVPPSIYRWICVLHSTLLLRNTQFMEDHNLYWPSKLFAHFGNKCQWGRSFREFCGEVQRVISSCFGFVPQHLHLIRMHYWLLHCMVMHNSLYKLS